MKQQLPPLGISLGRTASILLIIAALATLFAPAIIQLTGQRTDPSLLDNRTPTRMPAMPTSLSRGAIAQFHSELVRFIDDNFGLRVEMVRLNIRARRVIGVSAIPGLLIGKHGWFFLKTDSNVLDQVRALDRFTDQDLDAWIDIMELQRQRVESEGAGFVIVIAPNPHTIYPEHLPAYVNRVWPETRLDQIMRRLKERGSSLVVVDPRRDLWAARQENLLYHRYEDHWNSHGAFIAYSALMRDIQKIVPAVQPLQLSDYAITQGRRVWSIPPLEEATPVFSLKSGTHVIERRSIDDKNPLRPIVETTTRLQGAPTALVYGDSFGDVMTPFFNETFHRTIVVPTASSSFPTNLIRRYKPDVVIVEMVERALSHRPPVSETLESAYLSRSAPSLDEAVRRSSGFGGRIEGAHETEGRIEFFGWAVDRTANAPAQLALAYYETQAVGAARMSLMRADIAPSMYDQKAGFRLSVPTNLGLRDPTRLRFFGIAASGKMYELTITPALRQHLEGLLPSSGAATQGATPN